MRLPGSMNGFWVPSEFTDTSTGKQFTKLERMQAVLATAMGEISRTDDVSQLMAGLGGLSVVELLFTRATYGSFGRFMKRHFTFSLNRRIKSLM